MKNNNVKRVLLIVLALFLFSYVVYQIYISASGSIKTEYALSYAYKESIETTGYVVKDEVVLQEASGGTISYLVSNGGRVAQGAVVAQIFSSEEEAEAQVKINQLSQTVTELENLQNKGKYLSADVTRLDERINEKLMNFLSVTDKPGLKGLNNASDELLSVLNEKVAAVGRESDFSAKIAQLNSEIETLKSRLSGTRADITAPDSGYFVNATDGYEGQYQVKDAANFTVEQYKTAISAQPSGTAGSGKIITGYEWYFVALLDAKQAETLSVGRALSVTVPKVTSEAIPVTIKALNYNNTGEKCVAVLECTYMNSVLSSLRKEKIELCIGTYKGLRVSTRAVRVVDGVTGVYILSGIEAKFVPVEILYNDVGFVVCKFDNTNSSTLDLYDEVIVEGDDIYDGKIIK